MENGKKMKTKKHRYELYRSTLGWTLVDMIGGKEWQLDEEIMKKSIPIPKHFAIEAMHHIKKLIMCFDPEE